MSWLSGTWVLGLGLVFGLKHALDADHVAAVATIVSESKSVRRSSMVGMLWGVGHTLALLVAGVAVIVLHLTEWREFRDLDPASLSAVVAQRHIVDGRNALDAARWRDAGWTYRALGRP